MHKNWYIQGELFSLTKKKEKTSLCNSRALFTRKAPTKKEHLWRGKRDVILVSCLNFSNFLSLVMAITAMCLFRYVDISLKKLADCCSSESSGQLLTRQKVIHQMLNTSKCFILHLL